MDGDENDHGRKTTDLGKKIELDIDPKTVNEGAKSSSRKSLSGRKSKKKKKQIKQSGDLRNYFFPINGKSHGT